MVTRPIAGKFSSILAGVIFILASMFFGGVAIYASLSGPTASAWAWVVIAVLNIGLVEGGVSWIRKSMQINPKNLDLEIGKSASAKLGRGYAGLKVAGQVFLTVILIAILYEAALFYSVGAERSLMPSVQFYVYVTIILLYAAARPAFVELFNALVKPLKKLLVTYKLEKDGIVFDIKIWGADKSSIKVSYDELEEVKVLSYQEAYALQRYSIGPNLTLMKQVAQDSVDYTKGKIPRPNYVSIINSMGKTLMLKGPGVFYLVTVAGNAEDVVKGFENF